MRFFLRSEWCRPTDCLVPICRAAIADASSACSGLIRALRLLPSELQIFEQVLSNRIGSYLKKIDVNSRHLLCNLFNRRLKRCKLIAKSNLKIRNLSPSKPILPTSFKSLRTKKYRQFTCGLLTVADPEGAKGHTPAPNPKSRPSEEKLCELLSSWLSVLTLTLAMITFCTFVRED